jgi:hypothetical protein
MLLFLAFGSTSQHLIGQLYIGLCNILRHSSCFSAIFITLVWGCLRFLLLSSLLLCVSTPNTLMSTPMSGVCSWISKIRTSTTSNSNIGNKNYTINPNTQVLAFHNYCCLLSNHFCLHYVNLTFHLYSIHRQMNTLR